MTDALVVHPHESRLARVDPQALIAQAIEKGAGIDTMERLVALAKDVREVQAREAWYAAMAEFQRTCPTIKKTARAKIQTRGGGSFEYSFAPLDEIMGTIQPIMGPLGLSVSWRSKFEKDAVIVSCRISHTFGHHEESGDVPMPVVQGDGGANPQQRVGIATTYAKRYSLLGIIGMAPEDDDDAESQKQEGGSDRHGAPTAGPEGEVVISEGQVRKFSAIATGHKWNDEQLHRLLADYSYESRTHVKVKDYDEILEKLKAGPKAPQPAGQQTLA